MTKCPCKGSFLERFIQPAILIFVTKEPLHGFSIYKKLVTSDFMDYSGIDPSGLYRTLKKMEESGLLISEWDTSNLPQAKRIYHITEEGKCCLQNWKKTLSSYKESIEHLILAISKSISEDENY